MLIMVKLYHHFSIHLHAVVHKYLSMGITLPLYHIVNFTVFSIALVAGPEIPGSIPGATRFSE
jgi:hypothetical protein